MYVERFNLAGRVAVVTGAGQGIGLACCEALCEAGAAVVLTDISAERAEAGRAALAEKGHSVEAAVIDIGRSESINAVADRLASTGRTADILIANAGIAHAGVPAEDLSDADWERMIGINLSGAFRSCRAFGKHMLAQGRGSIVTIGSMSGSIVNRPQQQAHYNAAKAGVHHLTRSLAAEWATRGVRVNCVAPTYIDTPLLTFAKEDKPMYDQWLDMTPMHRLGLPAEIASVALFLASDASSLMTGSVVAADAGYTCW
ncbi:MAG: SDR family oxidoreductase [Rhodobacteraceae bacterium]|jgi:NAD(P)-dependent dehydrogenase (short-subunit alcohol dehydrogenase family)|nr:SDR family oxidoreductase [Paracoccaceae bacterium]